MIKFVSLGSGSSGNAHYIETSNTKILIDCGINGKTLQSRLNEIGVSPEELDGIVLTHEHRDHVAGVGIASRKYNLKIYANEKTIMESFPIIGKVDFNNIRVFKSNFRINDLLIEPFNVSHDAKDPVQFTIKNEDRKITILTDLGIVTDEILEKTKDSDIFLVEANHDVDLLLNGRYKYTLKRRILSSKGHLSNEDAGKFLIKQRVKKSNHVVLAHLSSENTTEEITFNHVKNMLVKENLPCNLSLSYRNKIGKIIEL